MTARTKQQLYDRFCSGGSAKNSISQIETEFEDLIDTFFGDLTDYSDDSTIAGWSSYTTKTLYYKKIGKKVYVDFWIQGTSNLATTTFTLPSTANASTHSYQVITRIKNNGTFAVGFLNLNSGSSSVAFFKSALSDTANDWTTSGVKGIYGQFFYEEA